MLIESTIITRRHLLRISDKITSGNVGGVGNDSTGLHAEELDLSEMVADEMGDDGEDFVGVNGQAGSQNSAFLTRGKTQ